MSKIAHQINAEKREIFGKKVKSLRKNGLVPSTIYGHGFEPVSIQFNYLEIERMYDEVGESALTEILLEKSKIPVLFKNVQYHPVTDTLIHIDCHHVNLKEKITAMVPVELIGESPAVKAGNVLVNVTDEIEIESLPADLPESIEIDISILTEVDSHVTVADLKLDSDKVHVKSHADQVIVMVEAPRTEEEVTLEETTTPTVAPAMNQKTPEELAAKAAEKKAEKKD